MRIGYLYNLQAYPPRGGNHVHALELTQGFIALGHTVSTVDDPGMPGVTNFDSDADDLSHFIAAIDVLYVRIDARFTGDWKALNDCVELAGNIPIVWEINAPANEALAFSWLGGRVSETGFKQEGTVRWLRRWLHAKRKLPGIRNEEQHRNKLAANVASAICVSAALGRYATEGLGIADALVLPNGGPIISEEEINTRRARRKHEEFTVLYSGSATYPWQGLDILAGVIALAAQEAPDIKFMLAVNQRIPGLPDSSNVLIREGLGREEILDAICAADVCVALHPEYHWSEWGFHGSPMKLFEYMACMRASVTSDLGQMEDILQDGSDAILCKNEPRDILNKLIALRDDPQRTLEIGRQGWARIQSDFNWPRNVDESVKVFQRAIDMADR